MCVLSPHGMYLVCPVTGLPVRQVLHAMWGVTHGNRWQAQRYGCAWTPGCTRRNDSTQSASPPRRPTQPTATRWHPCSLSTSSTPCSLLSPPSAPSSPHLPTGSHQQARAPPAHNPTILLTYPPSHRTTSARPNASSSDGSSSRCSCSKRVVGWTPAADVIVTPTRRADCSDMRQ